MLWVVNRVYDVWWGVGTGVASRRQLLPCILHLHLSLSFEVAGAVDITPQVHHSSKFPTSDEGSHYLGLVVERSSFMSSSGKGHNISFQARSSVSSTSGHTQRWAVHRKSHQIKATPKMICNRCREAPF